MAQDNQAKIQEAKALVQELNKDLSKLGITPQPVEIRMGYADEKAIQQDRVYVHFVFNNKESGIASGTDLSTKKGIKAKNGPLTPEKYIEEQFKNNSSEYAKYKDKLFFRVHYAMLLKRYSHLLTANISVTPSSTPGTSVPTSTASSSSTPKITPIPVVAPAPTQASVVIPPSSALVTPATAATPPVTPVSKPAAITPIKAVASPSSTPAAVPVPIPVKPIATAQPPTTSSLTTTPQPQSSLPFPEVENQTQPTKQVMKGLNAVLAAQIKAAATTVVQPEKEKEKEAVKVEEKKKEVDVKRLSGSMASVTNHNKPIQKTKQPDPTSKKGKEDEVELTTVTPVPKKS